MRFSLCFLFQTFRRGARYFNLVESFLFLGLDLVITLKVEMVLARLSAARLFYTVFNRAVIGPLSEAG